VDRTGENRLASGQNYRRGMAVPLNAFRPVFPVVTAAVCGRALSCRRQTLLTDRPRRLERKADSTSLQEAASNKLL
jgi:hypothetical protein